MSKISFMTTWFLMILVTFFSSAATRADGNTSVTATVDRNALNPDDTLTLTVSVESQGEINAGQPTLPSLTDFEVLNQWSSSAQSASMVSGPNGPQFKKTYAQNYNFMLQPKRQGKLTIGAVEVVVDGAPVNTKPIQITVAPGAGAPAGKQQAGRGRSRQGGGGAFPPPGVFDDEDDDLFSQLLRRVQPQPGGSRTLPINPNDAFFVQVETDKTEVYVGEQVTASFYLYTRGFISDLDTLKYPSLHGFWKEDIEIATHLNFQSEVVNGVPYKKALLASFALFPIKEGTATVDSYTAKCSVIAAVDSFSGMAMGKPYTFTKSSQPVKITVKPVPVESRPADYSGAVGSFQVTSRVDDKSLTEGQPFTLRIRFEGRGNAKLIDLPPLATPEGLELYDNKNEARFFRTGQSYKEFQILLIPRREGDFTIPPISVSIFDPAQKTYVKKSTEAIVLHVGKALPGAKDQSMPLAEDSESRKAATSQAKVKELALATKDLTSINLSPAVFTSIWIVIFAAILGFLLWRARVELGWGQRKKDLMRSLHVRLGRVQTRAQAGDWRGVGTEMTNTVYFVLGQISGEGGAHVELDKLLLKAPPSVRRELAEPLAKQMEIFQVLTFAPEDVVGALKNPEQLSVAIQDMGKLMERAVSLGLASSEESSGRYGGFESGPRAS